MKLLKNIFLIVLFLSVANQTQAQEKKSNAENRAAKSMKNVTTQMKLSSDQEVLLADALVARYKNNAEKVNGKDLAKEEKQKIYRDTHKTFMKSLNPKFSKKEIEQINTILKEENKKAKKK